MTAAPSLSSAIFWTGTTSPEVPGCRANDDAGAMTSCFGKLPSASIRTQASRSTTSVRLY